MPAAYAHQSMALEVLNILDEDIKVIINRHLLNYLVGALGPDPLYYYNPLKGLPLYKKADLVHAMSMKEIFNLNKSPSEGYLAYILGLICHFTLDTKTHEYIYQIEKQGYSHIKMETELEKRIAKLNDLAFNKINFTKYIKPISDDVKDIALIFDLTPKKFNSCLKTMRLCTSYFMSFNPFKRGLTFMALKLSGQYKKNQDLVLQKKEDLHHKKCVDHLEAIYKDSIGHAKILIENYCNYLSFNQVQLNSYFNRTFEGAYNE